MQVGMLLELRTSFRDFWYIKTRHRPCVVIKVSLFVIMRMCMCMCMWLTVAVAACGVCA
jgi:hypothetical protein